MSLFGYSVNITPPDFWDEDPPEEDEMDANQEVEVELREILCAAMDGPLTEAEVKLLCWACGIDSASVLVRPVRPEWSHTESHGSGPF